MPLTAHSAPPGLPSQANSTGKQLPQFAACPRQKPSEGYKDWLALADYPNADFDICQTCFNTSIAPTKYARFIVHATPKPSGIAITCDFGTFWVRRAWVMIFMRDLPNLSTLAKLFGINCPEGDCPSQQDITKRIPAVRTWYSIADPMTGQLLTDFTVCSHCKLHIEALMPQLQGLLRPVSSTPVEATCDVRSPSKRCGMYLDHLQKIADNSEKSGYRDVSELVNFIKEMAKRAECPRNIPTNGSCYSMSNIPDLTVCEECYLEVIAPQRQTSTGLSTHLIDPGAQAVQFTCQLYSPRMREAWEQANARNDIDYLRQIVNTRRSKEREISLQLERLTQVWKQQKQQANNFANSAKLQQLLATGHAIASIGGSGYYTSNNSGAGTMWAQSSIAANQADQTMWEIQMLENEWKSRWE